MFNTYDLTGEYGIGYTNNLNQDGTNKFYFDLEDYDKIKNFCWYFSYHNQYVVAKDENHDTIYLHKLIMPSKEQVDHIKHKKYDNRKSQLRPASNAENCKNKSILKSNKSGVPGVWWNNRTSAWIAYITSDGVRISLGSFQKKEDAIEARYAAEDRYFKEYSYRKSMLLKENEENKNGIWKKESY